MNIYFKSSMYQVSNKIHQMNIYLVIDEYLV